MSDIATPLNDGSDFTVRHQSELPRGPPKMSAKTWSSQRIPSLKSSFLRRQFTTTWKGENNDDDHQDL